MTKEIFINQVEPWYGQEEKRAILEYLDSGGWIMEFKKTRELEEMICEYTGAKYCSIVTNGTVSLFVALKALGIGPGDEVIVPDYTMIATPNAVVLAGAKPVLVDIDPGTMCIDVDLAIMALSPKTKAVFHVSINGRAGEIQKLKELCKKKGVALIEDAAQSLGSCLGKQHLGTLGEIGSLSFSVPKIITTGQGGAILTNNESLYKKVCAIKDFGRTKGGIDIHDEMGWNFKFTDLQAVFGIEQMKKLSLRVEKKKHIYGLYKSLLKDTSDVSFLKTNLEEVAPWFMDIFVSDPGRLKEHLKSKNIGSRTIYPPVHSQKVFSSQKGDFKNTKDMCNRGLWLPSSSFLEDKDIERVCNEIRNYFK